MNAHFPNEKPDDIGQPAVPPPPPEPGETSEEYEKRTGIRPRPNWLDNLMASADRIAKRTKPWPGGEKMVQESVPGGPGEHLFDAADYAQAAADHSNLIQPGQELNKDVHHQAINRLNRARTKEHLALRGKFGIIEAFALHHVRIAAMAHDLHLMIQKLHPSSSPEQVALMEKIAVQIDNSFDECFGFSLMEILEAEAAEWQRANQMTELEGQEE